MGTGTNNAPHKNQCTASIPLFRDMFCVSILFVALPCLTHSQEAKFVSFIRDTHIEYAITCSPDGRNVYAGGIHTIVVFEHQADGTLKSQQVLNNDHLGVRDVHTIIDLAVSPDGRHLYAVSSSNQSLLVFSRDTSTGNIQPLLTISDEVFAGQYGLLPGGEPFHDLMISPNGKYLYWLYNTYDNRGILAVFERDSNSGLVTKIQALKNGDLELGPYNVPRWMAISPDGKHLYGGGGNNTKILIFACEMEMGTIVHVAFYDPAPSSPAGNWDRGGISISPDGLHLYVTDVFADKIMILARNFFDGGLELLQTIGANSPRNLLISPDGDQFYFVHYDQARYFALYGKDSQTGQLIAMNEYELKIENGIDTRARMSPLGDGIYMTTVDQGLTVIQRDTSTGDLFLAQRLGNDLGGTDRLRGSRAVEVSRDGRFLYVAARFEDAGISTFTRDQEQGTLTVTRSDSLPDVSAMIMAPDGRHLYVSSVSENTITNLAIDPSTGALRLAQTLQDTFDQTTDLTWAGTMAFSPECSHLYFNDGTNLRVYQRDPLAGTISPVQKLPGQEYGLHELISLAVSPDGRHLYWNNFTNGRPQVIATFERNIQTGELSFGSKVTLNGEYTYPWGAMAIKVSPDGRHVYAATGDFEADYDGEPRILIFKRDVITGELTSQQSVLITGWSETRDLEISSDGLKVYALVSGEGYGAGLLAFFDRDAATGELTLRERFQSWKEGVYGMFSPRDLTISPDGRYLYIADLNGVATFATGHSNTTVVAENHVDQTLPITFSLSQNYPNPFNPSTTIRFDLPRAGKIKLAVYNLAGELVSLLANGNFAAGSHHVELNASGLASGIYFYRLESAGFTLTRKLAVIR